MQKSSSIFLYLVIITFSYVDLKKSIISDDLEFDIGVTHSLRRLIKTRHYTVADAYAILEVLVIGTTLISISLSNDDQSLIFRC